eukprot:5493796-Pyramimonas_sp.AAC.1
MEEAGFEEQHWLVIGNTPGRRLKVQMPGDANAAMRKNGEWRQFSTPTIEGGPSRIFVGLDNSDKMVRREIQTKKMAGL